MTPSLNDDIHSLFPISLPLWYILGTCYMLIVLLGFLGNCMVLHAFPSPGVLEKKKVQFVLMVNLAITDILVLLVHGAPTVGVFFADKWPFGKGLCHVIALVKHTVFYMKLFSVMLISVHKAYTMCYPFDGQNLPKRDSVKTVVAFWVFSFLLNVIGLVGSDYTTFSWKFLSCNAKIYLQVELEWEGGLLLLVLGLAVSIIITSLLVIAPIARGIRVRRLERQANIERPHRSWMRRFVNFLRRNKSIASVVLVTATFLITMFPLFLVHLFKWLAVPTNPHFVLFGEIFVMLNLVSTPATYAVVNPRFLQFYREMLGTAPAAVLN